MSQPTFPERLGIAGSGAIACGLAKVARDAGAAEPAVLWARSESSAERVREQLGDIARVTTDLADLAACSMVVEAVVEDLATKSELFSRLHELVADDAILATTTSSLSIDELARGSGRPDRFAGIHVFNPVTRMALVELAFPPAVTDDTRSRAFALCEALGKTVVAVPDTPGFVVNRLIFPFLFDAVRMAERNGLEPEAIDTCVKLGAAHPMGPLALLDFVGIDVAVAIGDAIGEPVPETLRRMAAEGRLGRKSGAGFYEYG